MEMTLDEDGLEVLDLREDAAFMARHLHTRDVETQLDGLQRLSRALLESPETMLDELVQTAVTLCGADSAGISIEQAEADEASYYHWVATAGKYSGFMDAMLPRYPSACGVCLERDAPQHFVVTKKFFDLLGVEAPLVTDGILLPWKTDETRGTIFVMAHGRTEAFDGNDVKLMRMLADFAAMGFKKKAQHAAELAQESATSAARMAHALAHEINNPLQSMTNAAYLLAEGTDGQDPRVRGRELLDDIGRLSGLVKKLLVIPVAES